MHDQVVTPSASGRAKCQSFIVEATHLEPWKGGITLFGWYWDLVLTWHGCACKNHQQCEFTAYGMQIMTVLILTEVAQYSCGWYRVTFMVPVVTLAGLSSSRARIWAVNGSSILLELTRRLVNSCPTCTMMSNVISCCSIA